MHRQKKVHAIAAYAKTEGNVRHPISGNLHRAASISAIRVLRRYRRYAPVFLKDSKNERRYAVIW